MKITDIVQTVILICCLIMLPVLGLAYAFYSQATISSLEALDKSFGVMVGVFSGVATLAAAYIASLLFNDWREQKKYELEKEYIEKFSVCIFEIYQTIFSQSSLIQLMYNAYNKHNQLTTLKLDKVDFLNISEKDITCHHLSSIISAIIQGSKFEKHYDTFQEHLTFLCFMNESFSEMYFKYFANTYDNSPFKATHFEEHHCSPEDIKNYKTIMTCISKISPVKIDNQVHELNYEQLLASFTRSFNELNTEIIKYLKP